MPIRLGVFLLTLLLVCISLYAEFSRRPAAVPEAFWGTRFTTLQGGTVDLKSLRGKYMLMNFWGEWCATCVEEIPFLLKLEKKYPERLRILGLIKSADQAKAEKLIRKYGMMWPQVRLPESVEEMFAIRKFPTNLLIAPDGKIVMDGFSHHFPEFRRRMGDLDSVSAIDQSEIKLAPSPAKAEGP